MKIRAQYCRCSNCGNLLKNALLEFCPNCNAKFTNSRFLFFTITFSLGLIASFIVLIWYDMYNSEKYVLDNGINLLYIAMMIWYLPLVFGLLFFLSKNSHRLKRKEKGYYDSYKTAKIEIKMPYVEISYKYPALMIISIFLIVPAIMVPIVTNSI